ncbi:hypothetical protein TorRG33x02_311390 [Trema orientale]|uniref:Uncharacterized protein n=1 Tax=Trema orientale TaxID=63057 RepID=A0A2P5BRP5_TREOI|nr:hypothetical protein TorRG33x02_311390 [Trema orientale]
MENYWIVRSLFLPQLRQDVKAIESQQKQFYCSFRYCLRLNPYRHRKKPLRMIREVANICSVEFSSHSTRLLAFGSIAIIYDMRHDITPWCVLACNNKAASYVKLLDSKLSSLFSLATCD